MPKVLTKLRVDEISSVDRGAGDGCRVVLFKRHDRKAFGYAMPDISKAQYRGGTGSRLHMIQNLSREEAKHFLLHDRHGRQLQRDFPNVPFDELAGYVCEASRRPMEKHEVPPMSDHLIEVCKRVVLGDVDPPSEHELVAQIEKLATARRQPGETSAAAFVRLYEAQDADGLVLRKAVQIAKGIAHPFV
jgi:hypothetical protein